MKNQQTIEIVIKNMSTPGLFLTRKNVNISEVLRNIPEDHPNWKFISTLGSVVGEVIPTTCSKAAYMDLEAIGAVKEVTLSSARINPGFDLSKYLTHNDVITISGGPGASMMLGTRDQLVKTYRISDPSILDQLPQLPVVYDATASESHAMISVISGSDDDVVISLLGLKPTHITSHISKEYLQGHLGGPLTDALIKALSGRIFLNTVNRMKFGLGRQLSEAQAKEEANASFRDEEKLKSMRSLINSSF